MWVSKITEEDLSNEIIDKLLFEMKIVRTRCFFINFIYIL